MIYTRSLLNLFLNKKIKKKERDKKSVSLIKKKRSRGDEKW